MGEDREEDEDENLLFSFVSWAEKEEKKKDEKQCLR